MLQLFWIKEVLYIAGAGATAYFLLYLIFSRKHWSHGQVAFQILVFAFVNMLALDNSILGAIFGSITVRLDISLGVFLLILVAIWWRLILYIRLRFGDSDVDKSLLGRHDRKMYQDRRADAVDVDSGRNEPLQPNPLESDI